MIDVYDRDMTMDIWLILPYVIAWEKARPYDIAWKKTHHILGIYAYIPVSTRLLHILYTSVYDIVYQGYASI
jgi:hypothetical protein